MTKYEQVSDISYQQAVKWVHLKQYGDYMEQVLTKEAEEKAKRG